MWPSSKPFQISRGAVKQAAWMERDLLWTLLWFHKALQYSDLEKKEECTPLVVCESEELVVVFYFAEAFLVQLEVVHIPFILFHRDFHGLHPAILNSRFITILII